ncbi:hypothetical protein ADUPG1_001527, partial [Aduncisulcus paluster]
SDSGSVTVSIAVTVTVTVSATDTVSDTVTVSDPVTVTVTVTVSATDTVSDTVTVSGPVTVTVTIPALGLVALCFGLPCTVSALLLLILQFYCPLLALCLGSQSLILLSLRDYPSSSSSTLTAHFSVSVSACTLSLPGSDTVDCCSAPDSLAWPFGLLLVCFNLSLLRRGPLLLFRITAVLGIYRCSLNSSMATTVHCHCPVTVTTDFSRSCFAVIRTSITALFTLGVAFRSVLVRILKVFAG